MESLTTLINSYYPEPHASLMNGILLGRPLFVTQAFYNNLKAVGLIHIVVLSGMNITLLSAIIQRFILKIVGIKWTIFVTIFTIVSFVIFVGPSAPIVRAGIMGILSLVAILYGRKTLAVYSLFITSVIMVIINHGWITSISFQLSFAATLGIILFGSVEEEEESPYSTVIRQLADPDKTGSPTRSALEDDKSLNHKSLFINLKSYFIEELRISLSAQVFTLPIIFWYFRQVSFVSPIANILVAWLIAPIMVLGILTLILGFISWNLGFVFSWLAYPLLGFIVWVVEILAKVPFGSMKL